jgi:hypothetical protein
VSYSLSLDGVTASLVGRSLAGVGRLGFAKITSKLESTSATYATHWGESNMYGYAGLGLELALYQGLLGVAALDVTRFGLADGHRSNGAAAMFSVGLQYGF